MKKLIPLFLLCVSTSIFAKDKPGYSIAEINILNQEGYQKELWPKIKKLVDVAGGEVIIGGGKVEGIVGVPKVPDKITVIKFNKVQSAKDFYASEQYQSLKPLADKYVKVRLYIVEGE